MHHFTYRDNCLFAEDVSVEDIADAVGTPVYIYSEATLRRHYNVFENAFAGIDALIAYSVKANSNIAVLKIIASEGGGADVVSGGELMRALAAGIPPEKIVFSGVGKTPDEIRAALSARIYQFNVESAGELERISALASKAGQSAPVAIRVNPDVSAGGHDKISTGRRADKFGVAWDEARALYSRARALPGIEIKGVDMHIGSQIGDLAPFKAACEKAGKLIGDLREDGCVIERLDLGGGLGIPYQDGSAPPHPDAYAKMIKAVTASFNVQLIFEPGRMIAGNAGVLVARVLYEKPGADAPYLIIDAGMNDLIRPALYNAFHDIWPVRKTDRDLTEYDIAGPVCESSDIFARKRKLARLEQGDLVAIMSAGAYGAVQASQYNSRPLAPETVEVPEEQPAGPLRDNE